MFTILGADGKEYGPIPAVTLRQWISEGRAGAQTRVRLEGDTKWVPLQSVPEFTAVFQSSPPVPGRHTAALPPIVRTWAFLILALAVIDTVWMAVNAIGLISAFRQETFKPGFAFFFFWVLALAGIPIRVVSGMGLLQRQEWARRLAVYYAGFALLLGVYSLGNTAYWLLTNLSSASHALTSLQYLFNIGFGVLVFAFNLATLPALSQKAVKTAFASNRT